VDRYRGKKEDVNANAKQASANCTDKVLLFLTPTEVPPHPNRQHVIYPVLQWLGGEANRLIQAQVKNNVNARMVDGRTCGEGTEASVPEMSTMPLAQDQGMCLPSLPSFKHPALCTSMSIHILTYSSFCLIV
jgi:hypothetical protein